MNVRGSFLVIHEGDQIDKPNMRMLEAVLLNQQCDWVPHKRCRKPIRPIDLDDFAGIISLGGECIDPNERAWLRQAIDLDKWTLGICQGGQNIWEVASDSEPLPLGKKRQHKCGRYHLHWTEDGQSDPLLEPLREVAWMCQSHDHAFGVPVGAKCLVHSADASVTDQCPTHADISKGHSEGFRIKSCVYALQFHPEVSATEIPEWAEADSGRCWEIARAGWEFLNGWVVKAIG